MSDPAVPASGAVDVVNVPTRKSGEDSSHPTLEEVEHLPKFGRRRRSTHEHRKIDLHVFDPEGVDRLLHTLHLRHGIPHTIKDEYVINESFDLARTLRHFMDE